MPAEVKECDVLVIGTGASGSTAALAAKDKGLDVLVIEKEPVFGGTTVFSAGWLWVPGNPHGKEAGIQDSADDVRTYIRAQAGNRYDEDRLNGFLENIPKMVDFLQGKTSVKFFGGPAFPDYHGELPGSKTGGRSICAVPINGRELGENVKRYRRPRRELLVFGLTIGSGPDMRNFLNAKRSLRAAAYVARRLLISLWDRASQGRDLAFTNGAALGARFFKSLVDKQIPIWFESPAKTLIKENNRIVGAIVEREGKSIEVRARRGVIIATGGFAGNLERRKEMFPHHPSPTQHYSLAPETNTGDGLALGEAVGGVVDKSLLNPAAWMPVSRIPYRDGSVGTFMHLLDRGKPGTICVLPNAKRFTNESASYEDFVPDLFRSVAPGESASCYQIADHRSVRKYGIGFVKPAPVPMGQHIRSGYLIRANTIEELAGKIGVDPATLRSTIDRFNDNARKGEDPDFGRGSIPYNRYLGDPDHKPNPCLAPIETGPFYAVKILPGDIGTFAGLRTNRHAQVLDERGTVIEGLYAVGADNASVFGGAYPGGGATLGPATTFGFIAGQHIAGKA